MSNFERDVANAMLDKADERIKALETGLKDWIHQAGMFAHWSPQRIQENIEVYFTAETSAAKTKFTGPAGYRSAICEHCGRQFMDHSEEDLSCPQANRGGVG